LSSNLLRDAQFLRSFSGSGVFGANFLKLSKPRLQVKERIESNPPCQPARAAQNSKDQPAKIARADKARGR